MYDMFCMSVTLPCITVLPPPDNAFNCLFSPEGFAILVQECLTLSRNFDLTYIFTCLCFPIVVITINIKICRLVTRGNSVFNLA